MSLGPYFVTQTPGEPALITVTSPDGTARDITGYTVEGVLYDPAGADVSAGSVTQVVDATEGLVQFDFPQPSAFDTVGTHLLQLQLTNADPDVLDFSTTIDVEVQPLPPPDPEGTRVTPNRVYNSTGQVVGTADILIAQSEIGLVVGFDLADDDDWDALSDADQRWLEIAICHQAAFHASDTAATISSYRPAGATMVKTGDVQITYGPGGAAAEEGLLAPLARMALSNLSWSGMRTIHPAPFLVTLPTRESVWRPV